MLSPYLILILHAAATLFMTGAIWIVQVVHYPLFAKVGASGYASYQKSHEFLITFIVGPPMLLELATAAALLYQKPPPVPMSLVWAGLGLVIAIWLSTVFFQIPCHGRLNQSFDPAAHQLLVNSNWLRTVAWTLRSVLVCRMLMLCFK